MPCPCGRPESAEALALFENLVALLFVAAMLLAGSRRLGVPYPTLLSLAGVAVAALPFAPDVQIEPGVALAVFIAPALLDAAYDTSPRDLRRLWVPLLMLAVGVVLLTVAAVTWVGMQYAHLPFAAAVALGAVVAPPDAAATTAVMSQVGLPRHSSIVLKGEGLLNDATALLIFTAAVAAAGHTRSDFSTISLLLAAPGGLAFGALVGALYVPLAPFFAGTHSSIIMQFTGTFGVWLLATRLQISPVLAVMAYAMVIAHVNRERIAARDRVQSFAVWAAVVFVLNVLAFLLMGLQTRAVIAELPRAELWPALRVAGLVLLTVIVVRIIAIAVYHAISVQIWQRSKPRWLPHPVPWPATWVVSWCGMRGLLTLATSFALPAKFPGRNIIVLCAMGVVLGTLIIQGMTLKPLIRLLKVGNDEDEFKEELRQARAKILEAGLEAAKSEPKAVAAILQKQLRLAMQASAPQSDPTEPSQYDAGLLHAVAAQRGLLHELRRKSEVTDDIYRRLEEELDWVELAALPSHKIEVLEG